MHLFHLFAKKGKNGTQPWANSGRISRAIKSRGQGSIQYHGHTFWEVFLSCWGPCSSHVIRNRPNIWTCTIFVFWWILSRFVESILQARENVGRRFHGNDKVRLDSEIRGRSWSGWRPSGDQIIEIQSASTLSERKTSCWLQSALDHAFSLKVSNVCWRDCCLAIKEWLFIKSSSVQKENKWRFDR